VSNKFSEYSNEVVLAFQSFVSLVEGWGKVAEDMYIPLESLCD